MGQKAGMVEYRFETIFDKSTNFVLKIEGIVKNFGRDYKSNIIVRG